MSMNQFMHPRNIYKQPPNFKTLAVEFPDFRRHITADLSGKVTFDFKSIEALRALTCTLLQKDFGLDVELPLDKLIPTVPSRLNYVLWIEDLVSLISPKPDVVKGIDIGTGASCIYPLLMAKKNNWHILATEIDDGSIKYASNNVKRNNLDHLIKIVKVKEESTLLKELVSQSDEDFDFCVCNPPFFSSPKELNCNLKSRKLDRPRPKNAFCASTEEVVCKGGEVDYITRIINESKEIGTRIKIYSTMIGHKSSLPQLKKNLREVDVVSFKQTEFCQGNTTRWGLAWTFLDIDLRKIPESFVQAKNQLVKPLVYPIEKSTVITPYKISTVYDKLVEIFKELQFEFTEVKHVNKLIEFIIVAHSNTWANQRRKRREKLRLNSMDNSSESSPEKNSNVGSPGGVTETCEKLAELGLPSENKKRVLEDDRGYYNSKKLKTDALEKPGGVYLKAAIAVIKDESSVIGLQLNFIEGNGTKDALHQVLQYIKNNFKPM